ncbi:methylenetetrahydrofolate reduct [Wallemia mellicola]|uniref:Methylenetetrahydrofolate reduct n=1 Tax=Wallemia mellicola TaxID=1708541 RepID=A0A4T0SBM1_9BASI|nr:hypothetical protein E3Q23_03331 [Wallemia mellicola]TIB83598.1 methylenetetrahydrofolate reduct [Wallemia mellicola]TIB86547.1 methylenetetrahydrofolate reduct [Wallemia mellicola]TIB92294.1 methylenetetrahydrofolate reduct [Wallemia mellicola]TIB97561.1 methylenetetrahydrofolate reduct [Wallemia mellicola]
MKITEKLLAAEREDRLWWSFEFFPPPRFVDLSTTISAHSVQGMTNLVDRIERMRRLGPEFVDITWHSGGRTAELTTELVKTCQASIGVETCMHLTCTGMPREKVINALEEAKKNGCTNVLALRGDPPRGQTEWYPHPNGFTYAADLVRHIRQEYGDYFEVAVAGFPEGNLQYKHSSDKDNEIQYLKEKVDAGADLIMTQMFYDVDNFIDWCNKVREAGVTVPIVPGIMPIQTWNGFQKAVQMAQTKVPQDWMDQLEAVKEDDAKVREVGTKLVSDMCRKILDANVGIRGLHLYTMNLERGPKMILQELNLIPQTQILNPLPWRPSLTPTRRAENIRPIFWANRQKSYLSRTEMWDEFPNGRWGDSRSPAYGEIDGWGPTINFKLDEAREIWGEPLKYDDVCNLFSRFCLNDLKALPWSDQPPARETSVIDRQLAMMNKIGFFTINSQPAVNGARSDDPVHGWGPKGGYVYQKAYLEFFVSPDNLDKLISRIELNPMMTYYAVNRRGDLRTNTHSEGPNAVTWGVFPGKEIVQPTIVEAVSFMAWKDEAFELGYQWSDIYEKGSTSQQLIKDIMDSHFLVNVVHNDFKNGQDIFKPFLDEIANESAIKDTTKN